AVQQRLAQLVLDVQVRSRGEDEVRHLVACVAERIHHAHRGVDVAPRRTHHADDLEVGPELAALATLENEAKGLALSFRNRRKSDVHDMGRYRTACGRARTCLWA